MRSYSIRLVALAGLGVLGLAPFVACGGSGDGTFPAGTGSTTSGSGGAGGGSGGQGGGQLNCVVDGTLGPLEECDDGNAVDGDGCDNDCSFSCVKGTVNGDAKCDDQDPCNGAETCTDQHTCDAGTPAADGTACGQGKSCKSGVCSDDTCGDGFVSAGEDCDDGNLVDGDGCDACTFSCVSSDPAACTPADECSGQGTCDDATHTCAPGNPLADGTPCAGGGFCSAGVCTLATCGNAVTEPGEACDDGNALDGDGCDVDCTLSCVDPAVDCAAAPVCQLQTCNASAQCAAAPDPAQNGAACGAPNLVCNNGACIAPSAVCGNGVLEGGEQCDFGAGNGPGTGCEASCTFSCTMNPDSCADANSCNGVETCGAVTVNGKTGQKCSPGAPLANCTACAGGLCGAGTCKVSTCGDGCVDAGAGEQCEPPNSGTCDAACHTIVVAVCGNGVREAGEQCDDSNTTNLDACDAACKFEQDQRVDYLKMQFGTDMYCTANRLGSAITGGTAQSQLQTALDDGITDGSISILFKMLGLDDLSGTSDPAVALGVMNGAPETLGGSLMYDGNNDLDWWHIVDPLSIDANRNPIASLSGSIAAKVLNAGPGSLTINILLSGNPAALKMSNAKVTISIGATSVPLTSAQNPPGHLAAEHLDPALTSYATTGQKTANGAGKLCGNVTAASLAAVPIPASLVGGGLLACSQNYAATNSMLDVIIGGCNVLFIQQIKPTQPDTQDTNAPQAGAGAPYTLSANAQKVVSTCKDKNNQTVNLAACLSSAAYSSFFKLATNRVIVK